MKLLTSWFEDEIIDMQVNYLKESGEYPEKNEDELRDMASGDYDLFQIEWENMLDYLTEKMADNHYWKAKVNNFGWRNLDGQKFFKAETGKALLQAILPETDCSFRIYKFKKGFAIQNYHHDSPMGNEWYYILPCAYSTYEKNY